MPELDSFSRVSLKDFCLACAALAPGAMVVAGDLDCS